MLQSTGETVARALGGTSRGGFSFLVFGCWVAMGVWDWDLHLDWN